MIEMRGVNSYLQYCETGEDLSKTDTHSHNYHEICLLLSGQRRYFIKHTIYDVMPGNLVLIPKNQLHRSMIVGSKFHSRYNLWFEESDRVSMPKLIGQEAFVKLMESGCLSLPPIAVRRIRKDFEQLEQELYNQEEHFYASANLLLGDILLCALRNGSPKQRWQGDTASKVQEVTAYICENYAEDLSLGDVAKIACMEETYFSKRFKALIGCGFQEYLTQTRLRAAEELLRETSLSMQEVAKMCGFSGSNYFGDVFRRWQGVSPTEYRRKCRREEKTI